MMEIAPFLDSHTAQFLRRTERFLTAQGACSDDYIVDYTGKSSDRFFLINYEQEKFEDGDYYAHIIIGGRDGFSIGTGLRTALGILMAVFDKPENVVALCKFLAENPGEMPSKGGGNDFLAGFNNSGLSIDGLSGSLRLINTEANGERWAIATSENRRALQYVVSAIQYQSRERLGQRFAAIAEI